MSCGICGNIAGGTVLSAVTFFFGFVFRAKRQYEQQNYERALKIAEDALDLKPESEAANLLLAKSMEKLGDRKSAILVLKPFIRNKTAGVSLYREYVEFLVQNGNTEEVRNVLKHASKEVQDKCSDYICETPVSILRRVLMHRYRLWN